MRKINVFLLTTAIVLGTSALGSFATENTTKMRADEYLIIDLAKVLEEQEEESSAAEEASVEDTLTSFYLNLFDTENIGDYKVKGTLAEEPIVAQFLAQNATFTGFEAAGIYEITGKTTEDLDTYQLNLVLTDDANLYHYSLTDGVLMRTPLEALFGPEQECHISVTSSSNHWIVVHLRAAGKDEAAVTIAEVNDEKASESLEGQLEEETTHAQANSSVVETTKETQKAATKEPKTTKASSTTKAPETTKAPTTTPTTKAPETTASTTTAHSHTWVPVTTTVHHDATYKTVWVQDQAAWDETVVTKAAWDEQVLVTAAWDEPVYEWTAVCNVCGYQFPLGATGDDIMYHVFENPGCGGGWYDTQIQTGTTHHDAVYQTVHHDAETTTVHHDATGHNEQVVDQAAWDEQVTTGYKCSSCGATK